MAKSHWLIRQLLGEWAFALAALGIHLAYLLRTTFVDWPEMLVYPWFLTRGLLYYRDVVLAYVPGAYYFLYALYSVLGFSPISERVIAYGLIFTTDLLVYAVARVVTGKTLPALAALGFFVFWQPIFSGNTIWYETILAPLYLGVYLVTLRYITKPSQEIAIYLGLLLAAASLIKQTAVWPIAAISLFLFFSGKKRAVGFKHACIVGALPVAANLLVWGYFAVLGAGREYGFWAYGFLLGLTKADSYYILLPARNEIALIVPAFVPVVWLSLRKHMRESLLLMMLLFALVAAGLPRWGLHRLQPVLAFASVGFGMYLTHLIAEKRRKLFIAGVVTLLVTAALSWRSFRVFITLRDPMQPTFFSGTYSRLLEFVKRETRGDLFVYGNYDYLYFGLNARPVALPWVPLFPWNAEVAGMQRRIITALDDNRVPYVLYIPYHPASGYYLDYRPVELDTYIAESYEPVGSLPVPGGLLYRRRGN